MAAVWARLFRRSFLIWLGLGFAISSVWFWTRVAPTRKETGKIAFEEKVKVPKATWMSDGSHWPETWLSGEPNHSRGNHYHASIIQAMLAPPNSESVMGTES